MTTGATNNSCILVVFMTRFAGLTCRRGRDCHCSDDELISNYSLISWSPLHLHYRMKHKILHSHAGIILNPTSLHEITFLLHVPCISQVEFKYSSVMHINNEKFLWLHFSVYAIQLFSLFFWVFQEFSPQNPR